MENTTIEEWERIGVLTKKINDDLTKLTLLSSKLVGTTRAASIKRSSKHLNKFRSDAEDFMFSQGIKDISVFYSDDDARK